MVVSGNMKYTIDTTDFTGKKESIECSFVDQKNVIVSKAFRNNNARIIEVSYTSEKVGAPSILIDKWELKKPFWGLFGNSKWQEIKILPRQ